MCTGYRTFTQTHSLIQHSIIDEHTNSTYLAASPLLKNQSVASLPQSVVGVFSTDALGDGKPAGELALALAKAL